MTDGKCRECLLCKRNTEKDVCEPCFEAWLDASIDKNQEYYVPEKEA